MKAIQVKYISATNTKPSRLKAIAEAVPAITQSYDSAQDHAAERWAKTSHYMPRMDDNAYKVVALALCAEHGWSGEIVGGGLADGSWVFCFSDQSQKGA